jgi:hypothetical protein
VTPKYYAEPTYYTKFLFYKLFLFYIWFCNFRIVCFTNNKILKKKKKKVPYQQLRLHQRGLVVRLYHWDLLDQLVPLNLLRQPDQMGQEDLVDLVGLHLMRELVRARHPVDPVDLYINVQSNK